MHNLLWVGDAACPSGFARATHGVLDTLHEHYHVTVLGLNYRGDPHDYPYKIYAAAAGGDGFGVGRLIWMCDTAKPDVIVIQNDGWNIPRYVQMLRKFPEYDRVPVVAVVAVDGKNFIGEWLDGVAHTVFWTRWALDEARAGGYTGPATVIPLGVDLGTFYPEPTDRAALPEMYREAFIVGNVNRNQPRKRWDLTLRYFAEWVRGHGVGDAHLYLHVAPTGDTGIDVKRLAEYYGVFDRLMLREPPTHYGVGEDEMRRTYNLFDVAVSTAQGEGMGLTAMEAMACGVPFVGGDWAAFSDWAKGAAWLVPCTSTHVGPPYVNVIGGVPDEDGFINALDTLYRQQRYRVFYGEKGLARMREPRFRWEHIGARYLDVLSQTLRVGELTEDVWQDLGRPEEVKV